MEQEAEMTDGSYEDINQKILIESSHLILHLIQNS